MPRKNTKPLCTNVTEEQYGIIRQLASDEGIAIYLRRLIQQDAATRGIEWPTDPHNEEVKRDPWGQTGPAIDGVRSRAVDWGISGTIQRGKLDGKHYGYYLINEEGTFFLGQTSISAKNTLRNMGK